ncbi:MAG: hypothetical protein OEZ21_11565 [Candidatus Bathyarchaeota archaeon]|nr:hypothetical protein [Candidatus Bathyarchaeota archaeon]MDH5747570.1 hypothetical protein [Candidatus Bathyarchaeota archaeon]
MELASVFDVAFLLLTTVLTILSLSTLRMLARIGMDRSLFIPVMVSAAFFWYGSMISVVFDILLESTPNLIVAQDIIKLLRQVTWLIGLGILTSGVFSYWKITKHVKVPKHKLSLKQGKDEEKRGDELKKET